MTSVDSRPAIIAPPGFAAGGTSAPAPAKVV
jgi:hypothetical protein